MLVFSIRSHAALDVVVDLMKPDEAIVSVSASHEAALFPLQPLCAQLGLSFFFFPVFSYIIKTNRKMEMQVVTVVHGGKDGA